MTIVIQSVAAVHALQHVVVTRLYRQVNLLAEAFILRYDLYHLIAHVTWVRGGEVYPKLLAAGITVFANSFQQFSEVYLFAFLVKTIRIDVLSEQSY